MRRKPEEGFRDTLTITPQNVEKAAKLLRRPVKDIQEMLDKASPEDIKAGRVKVEITPPPNRFMHPIDDPVFKRSLV